MIYTELHCKSNFSFLEGASHADELVERAIELGYRGLAITDRNTLAGIVRGYAAAKETQFPFIVGTELHPIDGPPVLIWPRDRAAYGGLCRLLTLGRMRATKGECQLTWQDIAEHADGWLAGLCLRQPTPLEPLPEDFDDHPPEPFTPLPFASPTQTNASPAEPFSARSSVPDRIWPPAHFAVDRDADWLRWLNVFKDIFGQQGSLMCELQLGIDDRAKIERLVQLSRASGVALLAGGDVQYHSPERMILHDCVAAIRARTTVDAIRHQRPANGQHYLRTLEDIQRLYRSIPQAVERTNEIGDQCQFRLDQLRYEYPVELAPEGYTPIEYLKYLARKGAEKRYPAGVPSKIEELLKHELQLIEELRYEAYFLTVWDLVRYARQRGILCQGRGSAANSVVCFCLGVTSVDPAQLDLLFERFISRERNEAPDIDVDFEHQRREEVLQYIYEKYGRYRAGMTATVITYRTRSAIRDSGKALGVSQDKIDAIAKTVDSRSEAGGLQACCQEAGLDPTSPLGKRFLYVVQNLIGFPRHLSQHVGGMVMTRGWLCELCPIENASMEGRTVIQWDKDDLDELSILKVDCLSLGMLSAIHRSFDLLRQHYDVNLNLATVPHEDRKVYDMISQADTVGVFQIESRAQMSMLPRLRPRCYYDLVIEVAIVRPGPIQGQMVHPYLRARQTGEQPQYPTEAIAQVLAKTMGVPIFQEQAMRLAVVAAGFTPGEADQLRRAMAAWRRPGVIDRFRQKLIHGMLANGLTQQFAESVFTQIRGFGEYGFPESHAASFALLVYVSAWIKCHYPAVFCAALLNSQPLGFYAPAQLVQDAQRHGVTVAGIDVNHSDWETTLEPLSNAIRKPGGRRLQREYQLRLGLHQVQGMQEELARRLVEQRRSGGRFQDVTQLQQRTGIGQGLLTKLAEAGALNSVTGHRRAAMWQSMAQERSAGTLSLLEATGADEDDEIPEPLRPLSPREEVFTDYQTTGLSLRGHPLSFYRNFLNTKRVKTASQLPTLRHGQYVAVAGMVLLRQRPGTAKGITFVTLEDETGSINLVIKIEIWERFYKIAKQSNMWLAHGVLENRSGVIHVVVGRLEDFSQAVPLDHPSRDFR
jgi:error-prone DNA polymerase